MIPPIRHLLSVVAMTVFASGCAEVSFKRGGSAADFDADKATCQREIAGTDRRLADCLDARGWYLHQFDSEADVDASTPAGPDNSAGTAAAGAETGAATDSTTAPAKATPQRPKAKAPAKPAVIGTWFKFGAGPDALEADQAACVATLGETHRIVTGQPVSPAMRACMKQRGWYGLESTGTR